MALYKYPRFKIRTESHKTHGLQIGDVVKRQFAQGKSTIFSLMVVLEIGMDIILGKESYYFIGALIEGYEPKDGDFLDFVRVTSLFNSNRSGALYLTASDSDSPYMDVIDGMGIDHSLCYPITDGGIVDVPAKDKYAYIGGSHIKTSYLPKFNDISRIFELQRKSSIGSGKIGIKVTIPEQIAYPEAIIISYQANSSKTMKGVPISFGYTSGEKFEAKTESDYQYQWKYELFVVKIEYPAQYSRSFFIDLSSHLVYANDWFEIADLNIVRLSDISNFSRATNTRVGKIKGIKDPVFGTLAGYGAYFQNLYATKNVNIAGTLTAGDENGFSSTFYVGKIHKNVIPNSSECEFTSSTVVDFPSPVGIGKIRLIENGSKITVQYAQWRNDKAGSPYCFSIWIKGDPGNIEILTEGLFPQKIEIISADQWQRYNIPIIIQKGTGALILTMKTFGGTIMVTAPQLEAGTTASQYQPTDDTLSYTEDYGAWFTKGGVGGTIQNPLLRLNDDGSICSRDGSFVINKDGTGHFSKGAIRWYEDRVEFSENVKLQWTNLSNETQENLKGQPGKNGVDANLLDWINDWDSSKTIIDAYSVITPKIFAGIKNTNGTLTGIALGHFPLSVRNDFGTIVTETVNGVYGFNDGYKTFFIDNQGNAQLGRGAQFIKYNALTGKVEFGSDVSLNWVGATYIDRNGIFTGTLSANTVNAIKINADQITAGTISSDRIDVESLKSRLITAENINALTLNVVRGKIGGWVIGSNYLALGTIANTSGYFAGTAGHMTLGSAGIRSCFWRLEADGSGALANSGIKWDTSGNVIFGPSVTINWTQPIDKITNNLGGSSFSRITQLTMTGIYTGTLDADQIVTGYLSANRIKTGSLDASKLNAESIRANIINTDYISGLALNFTKGKIGGWSIDQDSITNLETIATANTCLQIRTKATGSGAWYNGLYRPRGISMYWQRNNSAGHLVLGEISNGGGSSVKTGYYGLQMGGFPGREYFCLSANIHADYTEVYNRIAGWGFDHERIWKNSVSLGADGSITNGGRWQLNNDGSGQIANGNISWTSSGAVSFSPQVSMIWENPVDDTARELASAMAFGKMLYRDPTFFEGYNSLIPYNNAFNGTVTHSRMQDNTAPNDSKYVVQIQNTGYSSPICGGFHFGTQTSYRKVFITRFLAKIPAGRILVFATNNMGIGASDKWLTPNVGTGDWCEYIYKVTCGTSNFSTTNFFYLTGEFGTPSAPVTWYLAYATVFDITSAEKYTTTIDANGIYTSTLNANQINAGFISADRIQANSIDASKLNAASIQANIINTQYINGLACSFTKGTIGGWVIGTDHLTYGVIGGVGSSPIQLRTSSSGSGFWYNGDYKPYGISMTWHNSNNAGHIIIGQIAESGSTVKSGFMGIQMMSWDHQEYFCLSTNYTRSGSKEVYNRIAGWGFDSTQIWKNSVCLGSDGSIYNGSYWRLNNDGSGQIANGNIWWNSAGIVYFSAAVSLNWTGQVDGIVNALGGTSYPKLTRINASGIYTGSISASQITVDSTLVVGGSSYNGSISVRDAYNSAKVTLDRTGITAVGGKIGGWLIDATTLTSDSGSSRVYIRNDGYLYNTNGSTTYWMLYPSGTAMFGAGRIYLNSDGSASLGSGRSYFYGDGSGRLANGNIAWDAPGTLTLKNAIMSNVTITGTIRNAFAKYDSSIWVNIGGSGNTNDQQVNAERYDNVCVFGGTDSGGWSLPNPTLPWTVNQSGRRLCLIHYRYGNEYAYGFNTITAPSGKYFFEDGIQKSTLVISREVVEIIGYGDPNTFYGWIVLTRQNLMTTGKYGYSMKILAMGTVSCNATNNVTIATKAFDGSKFTVTRNSVGNFTVYMPSSWGLNGNYMVMLSGVTSPVQNTPIYASLRSKSSYYFNVTTQDDASVNEGSFNFQIISTQDW